MDHRIGWDSMDIPIMVASNGGVRRIAKLKLQTQAQNQQMFVVFGQNHKKT